MQREYQPGDTVELKDKEAGFSDSETGFDISRSQQKPLGDQIGKRTHEALMSGGLLVVSGKSKKRDSGENGGVQTESDLPADLPGRDVFLAAGMNFEAVKRFNFDTDKVAGIGPATIKSLKEWADKNKPAE